MVHITKKIADAVTSTELDSPFEDKILEEWVEQNKLPDTSANVVGQGTFPATSKLNDRVIINKEVQLDEYRIDSIIYWYKSKWKLIEVKQESEVGPSVVGDLLVKAEIFEQSFTVNPNQIEKIILSDRISNHYRHLIKQINVKYDTDIKLAEIE